MFTGKIDLSPCPVGFDKSNWFTRLRYRSLHALPADTIPTLNIVGLRRTVYQTGAT